MIQILSVAKVRVELTRPKATGFESVVSAIPPLGLTNTFYQSRPVLSMTRTFTVCAATPTTKVDDQPLQS